MAQIFDIPVCWKMVGYVSIELSDRDKPYSTEEILDFAYEQRRDFPYPEDGNPVSDIEILYDCPIYKNGKEVQ